MASGAISAEILKAPSSSEQELSPLPTYAKRVTDISQAVSIQINQTVYELRRQGKQVTVLSLGEAFFSLPQLNFDIDLIEPGYHYSESRGLPALRQEIASFYLRHHRVNVDPDTQVIVSAGSKLLIYMVMLAVAEPGDEAIILEPAWVSYTEQARLAGIKPVTVPYGTCIADLRRFTSPRSKLLIINNPNNPSGYVYTKDELIELHRFALEHNLFILSDEAYSEFTAQSPFLSIGEIDPELERSCIVNSLSKNFGMSGWRIGFAMATPRLTSQILKVGQHLITCPATLLSSHVARNFKNLVASATPQIHETVTRRNRIYQFAKEDLGLTLMPGDSTFYMMPSIAPSRLSSWDFSTELLARHHICVVPGIGYGASCDRFVRVSVGTESEEQVRKALARLHSLIEETR